MTMLGFCCHPRVSLDLFEIGNTALHLHPTGGAVQDSDAGFVMTGADCASNTDKALVLEGRPRWNGQPMDASGLLEMFGQPGSPPLTRLNGAFALALYDLRERKLVLAVDRMGIERLTYSLSPEGICFGTWATQVRQVPGFHTDIDNQSIYNYLFFHMVPSPGTAFQRIRKLPPAHRLEWQEGHADTNSYWSPDFRSRSRASTGELSAELHSILQNTTRALQPDQKTGAFLSGGLDSSTVTGHLSQVVSNRVNTFSIGFDLSAYDELKYARLVTAHFCCHAHEYHVTPDDIVDAFSRVAGAYDEPFGNSSVVPTYFCAKQASDSGMTHLLAGDGGDELFGGNTRYVQQKILEAYGYAPRSIRSTVVQPLVKQIPPNTSWTVLRKIRRYVEQATIPLPARLGINFAFSVGLADKLSPDFSRSIDQDAPLAHMENVYASVDSEDLLDRLLAYDWRFTLADNDLRKVGRMCELAGITVSYPMLDNDLVDFSTKIPPSKKIRGLQLRSFFKQAVRGFLPDEILKKSKHGFGLPFGHWLRTDARLKELIYSNLADLDSRAFFKAGFIEDLKRQHQTEAPSFYGYFIWDLAILEEWLKKHS